ncbi:MAG: superoxide dismutase [Phycisphaerales bacterium]
MHEMSTGMNGIARRDVIALGAMGALGAALSGAGMAQTGAARKAWPSPEQLGWDAEKGEYTLPRLKYAYDAMEPHIDAKTMEIHHSKHHQGYVNGLNRAIKELEKIRTGEGDAGLIKHWQRELAFHGGGHVNHTLFWLTMVPPSMEAPRNPSLGMMEAAERSFGSFDAMLRQLEVAANGVEGSGWAWIGWEGMSERLVVLQMEKQQDGWVAGVTPLVGVDVWEHAYYLKYQNRRGDYVKAWMNLINWPAVDELFARARGL